ncbi:MAG TPA: HEAT repeat domain-containing protein [Phycisphaerae bacterium]|nr:HEAT repeat domain-containing protein [Phycisphaerae bacterium]
MSKRDLAALVLGLSALVAVGAAVAQEEAPAEPATQPAAQPEGKDLEALWNDLLHYIQVARPDLALSYGKAILDNPDAAGQLFILASKTPGARAELGRAARNEQLKPVIGKIVRMIEKGYTAERSDPARIAQAIEMLGGSSREFQIACERLLKSGEYAMPQLITKLRSPDAPESLKDRIVTFLPSMKLEAVRPLAEALQSDDPLLLRRLATVLGQIGYPHAAPMLMDVLQSPQLKAPAKAAPGAGRSMEAVRTAVQAALVACAGKEAINKTVTHLYYELAEQYYYRAESLQSDPRAEQGNVWFWQKDLGLTYKSVPREIFCDVYAMRYARVSLDRDANLGAAVSLWLAAYLRKEADLPAGAKDPTQADDRPPAKFFGLASGPKYLLEVLARGLKDKDVPVAIGAIGALARTGGAKSLATAASGGTQPLVDAMSFPDGRVRFFAAVTLAASSPTEQFVGWQMVIPTLNDALRMSGSKRGILVADSSDLGNKVKGLMRAGGWDVVEAAEPGPAIAAAMDVGGADVIVLVDKANAAGAVQAFRREAMTAKATVIAIGRQKPALAKLAETDKSLVILAGDAGDAEISAALSAAAKSGPQTGLTEEEAGRWAIKAAQVVRALGLEQNKVLAADSALLPLAGLLGDKRAEVRLAAAAALAVMSKPPAQQAIVQLALSGDADEKVRVAAFHSATESVRRFGNLLTEAQSTAVLEAVSAGGSPELRDAAAQLLGALNLPSEKIKSLILQTAG